MDEEAALDPVARFTGYLLYRLGDDVAATIEVALAPLGLRGRHLRVLGFLDESRHSQRDLGRLTGMDRTTMVAVIDQLERLGFVERTRSDTDRRKHLIRRTAAGTTVFAAAAARLDAAERAFLTPLAEDERVELDRLLRVLYANRADTTHTVERRKLE